jgi:hypothetical protein
MTDEDRLRMIRQITLRVLNGQISAEQAMYVIIPVTEVPSDPSKPRCIDPTCLKDAGHEGFHFQGGHVKTAQDPAKMAAAIERDRQGMMIVQEAIDKHTELPRGCQP